MSYLVLALKYRPQRFADVTGQGHISRTLANALRTGRTAHAYLFCGPRGVGKTSMARILAKALTCERGLGEEPCNECAPCREVTAGNALDVIEIDGASNRGIDDIRDLREAVRYAPARLSHKIYIIDEVHMLTQDAFNALLKTLEEPPRHVVFILATTEPLKVPATILSRCQRFEFARLRVADGAQRLAEICGAEGIAAERDALELLARKGEGSMRDALTLLDQSVASGVTPITAQSLREALGIAGRELFFEWTQSIARHDTAAALRSLANAVDSGKNLQELAEEFLQHLRNLLMAATDPSLVELLDATGEERAEYTRQAGEHGAADVLRHCRLAMEAANQMRRSAYPRVHLEVALAEMCALPRSVELRRFIEVARGQLGAAPATSATPAPLASTSPSTSAATMETTLPPTSTAAVASTPISKKGTATTGTPTPVREPEPSSDRVEDPMVANEARNPPSAISSEDPWLRVLHAVGSARPAIAATLVGSSAVCEGTELRVFVADWNPFRRDQLDRKEAKRLVSEIVAKEYAAALTVRFLAGAPAGSEMRVPALGANPAPGSDPGSTNADGGAPGAASPERIRRIADLFDGDVIGPA